MADRAGKDWVAEFNEDQQSPKWDRWLRQANMADRFCENTVTLSDLGLRQDDRGYCLWNPIPEVLDTLWGQAFGSPLQVSVRPHEGKFAEEDVSKIGEYILEFERHQARGPYRQKMLVEMLLAVALGMRKGNGYLDQRIDFSLRSPSFPRGTPIHSSLNSQDVVLDRRASRWEQIQHLHIIHSIWPEELLLMFGDNAQALELRMNSQEDDGQRQGKKELIETQYLRLTLERLWHLQDSQRRELGLDAEAIWDRDLNNLVLRRQGEDPQAWSGFNRALFLRNNVPDDSVLDHGWWSCYGINILGEEGTPRGLKANRDDYYIGSASTVSIFQPFRMQNSPYGVGVPYFLKDQTLLLMLQKTQEMRWMQTFRKRGEIHLKEPSQAYKDRYEKNELGGLDWIFDKIVPEGITSVDQVIKEKGTNADMQNLMLYGERQEASIRNRFYSSVMAGKSPYAQASGEAIQALQGMGSKVFNVIIAPITEFLTETHNRALHLDVATISARNLLLIAAENDKGRQELILTGKFFERINAFNARVVLDLSSPEDRMMRQQVAMKLLPLAPEPIFLEVLGFDEPVKTSEIIYEKLAQADQDRAVGKKLRELNPAAQEEVLDLIGRLTQTEQALKLLQAPGAARRAG